MIVEILTTCKVFKDGVHANLTCGQFNGLPTCLHLPVSGRKHVTIVCIVHMFSPAVYLGTKYRHDLINLTYST